jgi:hypothetical protein
VNLATVIDDDTVGPPNNTSHLFTQPHHHHYNIESPIIANLQQPTTIRNMVNFHVCFVFSVLTAAVSLDGALATNDVIVQVRVIGRNLFITEFERNTASQMNTFETIILRIFFCLMYY